VITVYKYKLDHGLVTLELPFAAQFLAADVQGFQWTAWFQVDTDKPLTKREFQVFGTGHEMPSDCGWLHCATFFQGSLVWHLFEKMREPTDTAMRRPTGTAP
jgi:hypothetical protein